MSKDYAIRSMQVRTWPERMDVVVVDGTRLFGHYEIDERPEGEKWEGHPLWDKAAPAQARRQAALRDMELHQELFRMYWQIDDDKTVRLVLDEERENLRESILDEHGLSDEQVEVRNLRELLSTLQAKTLSDLWDLAADWYDFAVRFYPVGTSRQEGASENDFLGRLHPDHATGHFHKLASGDEEVAWRLFLDWLDVEGGDCGLYHVLVAALVAQSEFPGREIPLPAPLASLAKR